MCDHLKYCYGSMFSANVITQSIFSLPKDCKLTVCTYPVPQPRVEASVEEMEDRSVRSAEVEGREFEVQIL